MLRAIHDSSLRARILSVHPLAGVRAGSAVVWVEGRLLVVQDDATAVAWVDPETRAVTPLVLEGTGEASAKATKPDFEAAFVEPDGAIRILGSGSARARCRVARLDPRGGAVRFSDCARLFDALRESLGTTPNVEGAIRIGDRVRLFHRGSGSEPSVTLDVAAEALDGGAARVLASTRYDLGTAAGVPLTFTDACASGQRSVYLAVAEDTPNAIDDGPITGAAVGVIAGAEARYALLEEADGAPSVRKVEGIAFGGEGSIGYLVTDPDDPARAAELCVVRLEGFGGG